MRDASKNHTLPDEEVRPKVVELGVTRTERENVKNYSAQRTDKRNMDFSLSKRRALSERISFIIPKHLKKSLNDLQELIVEDRSTYLRKLVNNGLAEARVDIAAN